MFSYFQANGWIIRRRIKDADLVLLATCGFDTRSQELSMRLLSAADNKRKQGSTLVVTGCLAGIDPSRIRTTFDAITIPPVESDRLDEVIEAKIKLREIRDANYIDPSLRAAWNCFRYAERHPDTGRVRASIQDIQSSIHSALIHIGMDRPARSAVLNIKRILRCKRRPEAPFAKFYRLRVAHGCLGKCSYCAIRSAIGPLRSMPPEKILREFRTALDKGYREFQIVAGDTGAYGVDVGTNVVGLFRTFFGQKGKFRLTIMDFNLEWLIAHSGELVDLLSEHSHRIRFLSIPVQSGSDGILKLMRRRYTASEATECLCRLRKACPEMFLNTHVMVGFPTETDEDFERTVRLLREVEFNGIDIFRYCDRPDTAASQMTNKVPKEMIDGRVLRLRNEFHQSRV